MRVKTRVGLCLMVLVACALGSAAISYAQETYAYLGPKWPTPTATFLIHLPADPLGNDLFEQAANAWNSSTVFRFGVVRTPTTIPPCFGLGRVDNRNTAAFLTNAQLIATCGSQFGAGTLAITLLRSSGDVMTDTDIIFNADLPWFFYSGPWRDNPGDFRRVAVHELGHALGLEHEVVSRSIMQPLQFAGDTLEAPAPHDIRAVNRLYDPPSVTISTNAASYQTGDQMTVTVSIAPHSVVEPAYLLVALNTPTTGVNDFLLYRFTPNQRFTPISSALAQVHATGSLDPLAARPVSTLQTESGTVLNQQLPLALPEGFPSGSYQWQAALLSSGGQLLSSIVGASFVFTATTPSCGDPFEPNDTAFQAVGPLVRGVSYTGRICTGTDADWFWLSASRSGTISLSLSVPPGRDYDLELYDAFLNLVAVTGRGPGLSEAINYFTFFGGPYYVRVVGFFSSDPVATYSLGGFWP